MHPYSDLAQKKCTPCEGGIPPLTEPIIREVLKELSGWSYAGGQIVREFHFKDYHETVAFVNAVAWIAHSQDHHPALEFGYKTCRVSYFTHAIKGISDNDLICAAKVNALVE